MRKLAAKILIFLVIFGVSFSNIPFYVLTGAFDAHMKAHNIVDKAWHLSQDSNVVDKFTSYRNLIEKIKVYEARAATETKWASSHLSGTCTNPNNALGTTNGTWAGDTNSNTNCTSDYAMENPSGSLTGTQTINVVARKGTNSGNPTLAIDLYENGSLVQSIAGATSVTSTSGQTISGTFDGSVITNPNNVEIGIVIVGA